VQVGDGELNVHCDGVARAPKLRVQLLARDLIVATQRRST